MNNQEFRSRLDSIALPGSAQDTERRTTITIVQAFRDRLYWLVKNVGAVLRLFRPGLVREMEELLGIIDEYLRRLRESP